MNRIRRAGSILPVLAVLGIIASTGGCAREPETSGSAAADSRRGPRPDSEQWDAVISLFEQGRKQAVIEARYMALFQLPEKNYTHMDTLEADFFDAEGVQSSHLVAESGEIYDQDRAGRRRIKTWGDVVLTASQGRTVRADTLWWNEARDLIYTFGPFEMMQSGEFIQGTGLEADTRLESYRFLNASGWSRQGGEWLEAEADSTRADSPDTLAATASDTLSETVPDSLRTIPPDTSRSRL